MLDGVLGIMVVSFKDVLEAYKNNLVEKETYQAWEGYVCSFLSMPGGTVWWEQAKFRYTAEVQQTVDFAIGKATPYDQRMPILFGAEARDSLTADSGN
jgi:hypothetical protein